MQSMKIENPIREQYLVHSMQSHYSPFPECNISYVVVSFLHEMVEHFGHFSDIRGPFGLFFI